MPWWLNPWAEVRRLRAEIEWVREEAREHRRQALDRAFHYVEVRYDMAQRQSEAMRNHLNAMAAVTPPKPIILSERPQGPDIWARPLAEMGDSTQRFLDGERF